MKAFLDACVLYPTVLREILIGCARAELYRPLWSPRVLEEWARATRKIPDGELFARGEIAALRAAFPASEVRPGEGTMARMYLPDTNDVHVLAAASDAAADRLVTLNIKDFPRRDVLAEGIELQNPDAFLMDLWLGDDATVAEVVEGVRATAERISGTAQPLRPLMKRARLPRLGKALSQDA
ncbi:PIN domain-containing protein [Jannaschia faecimaris]|uniref:PIN domain-containing protein n=1 Tax=Jannaschia faecimaris TaxID=1244108 RepID=A0A1H3RC37_9RHOB|nr:PIN domain-containing protein [Jannaschia faecimaris]SDZ22808.1 PIN domain-containing protein [Jannaschia faecimaris]